MSGVPLRVLHVISSMTWGGAELLLAELATALPRVNVTMSVIYLADVNGSPAAVRLRERGVDPFLVPMTKLYDPRGYLRVRAEIARLRPAVVHTHLGYADLLGAVSARTLRIPTVSTLHVMEWDRHGREGLKNGLMALGRRCSDRVVAVSDAGRQAYLDQGWGRPERVVTIHNGVGANPRPGGGAAIRSEFGLSPDDFVVVMVSVLREGKGHEVAARAVMGLREAYPNLRLLVVGEGPARSAVERALAPLGEAGVLAGYREDVMAILDAADVLIHPTRVDAFPTTLIEAMAASVPVVATAVGGIPEIVQSPSTGLLLDPPAAPADLAPAIETLLNDPEARRRMGQEGRRRFVDSFSAERWGRQLRALYDEVLAD